MSNYTTENFIKKGTKVVAGKLKLATGLRDEVTRNVTIRDLFTIALIIITIVVVLVL